ncbi:MAG TPA: prepilin-type N-terminal cleavage/methylation domain-containing protein [Acidimicrobiales bacterium]|nr:prepilin-type N-terminal cleavage/methylation domain-containing protein [Acidimicrobiales bacterium]
MLSTLEQRRNRDDQGFTLIELMVVVLIIAILLAIAIPTFLGARNQANSRAVQSTLRNALTAEQTYYTNNQSFGDTTTSPNINSIEPNITWATAAAPNSPNTVGVYIYASSAVAGSPDDVVWLQAMGKDGKCYTVYQTNAAGATGYTTAFAVDSACTPPTSATAPSITKGTAVEGAGFYTSW